MISLSISNGSATPITISDTGQSGYVLAAYNNGATIRENQIATSRFVDGGALTATRDVIVSLSATIRAWGTSYADLMTKIDTFGSAIGQFGYTVTETYSGGSVVYTCLPANYNVDYDPVNLSHNMAVITTQIPRQP